MKVLAGALVGTLVGWGIVLLVWWMISSSTESYEEERDRIFDETYTECTDDHETGRRVLPEVGGPSHYWYTCEGDARRAVERWRNEH